MTSGWAPAVDKVPARKKPVSSAGRKPLTLPVSGLRAQASGVGPRPEDKGTEVTCRHLHMLAVPSAMNLANPGDRNLSAANLPPMVNLAQFPAGSSSSCSIAKEATSSDSGLAPVNRLP